MPHNIGLMGGEPGERAQFIESEVGGRCRIACGYRGIEIEGVGEDFFEALCAVRETLEAEGLRPLCYGASANVYPSGMARDMGRGLKAYRMTSGRHARTEDLVGIFDVGADVNPVSVEAQRAWWRAWLSSARR